MKMPDFLKSSEYRFYIGLAIVAVVFLLVYKNVINKKKVEKNTEIITLQNKKPSEKASKIESFKSDVQPVSYNPKMQREEQSQTAAPRKVITAPIDIFTSAEETVGDVYAPTGLMIKCKLVNTVQSNNIATPIVGIVIESVWHNGRLVVPAGTHILGVAQGVSNFDRIASAGEWRFVWRNYPEPESGWELPIQGTALDCVEETDTEESLSDGSAGLRGRVIGNKETEFLAALMAKGIAGFGEGISRSVSVSGSGSTVTSTTGDFKSAAGQMLKQAADLAAQNFIQQLQQQVAFVRVHGGKDFYFFNTEPIDLSKARIGAKATNAKK